MSQQLGELLMGEDSSDHPLLPVELKQCLPLLALLGRGHGAWSRGQRLQNTRGWKWVCCGLWGGQGCWGTSGLVSKCGGAHLVQINRDLLQPLDVKVNPEIQPLDLNAGEGAAEEPPQPICLFD